MKILNKIIILLIILSIAGTLFIYNSLPDKIPTHFNFKGEVDSYGSKATIIFTAILPLGIYLLMTFLPKVDPKRKSYLKHQKAYDMTKIIISIFMIVMNWIIIIVGLGYGINVGMIVRVMLGLLFIVIGNYMSQIRHNYFFGIKTPWTLANEVVWKKTHRVGAISFLIAGLILVITSFFSGNIALISFIAALIIAVIYPTVYSYFEYKKITKKS